MILFEFTCKSGNEEAFNALKSDAEVKVVRFLKREDCDEDNIRVCSKCRVKVELVLQLQNEVSSSAPPPNAPENPPETKLVADVEEEEEEDLSDFDYEELNQLSSFYAELDDVDDPEYEPFVSKPSTSSSSSLSVRKKAKKSTKKSPSQFMCQLCVATLTRVSSLRRHYVTQHQYDVKAANNDDDDGDMEEEEDEPDNGAVSRIRCADCDEMFSNKHRLIKHALQCHVGQRIPSYSCSNCSKTYRHERDLKRHEERRLCAEDADDNGLECDICHKTYSVSQRLAHKTFAHLCRFCDHVSTDRRNKLRHLKSEHHTEMTDVCPDCGAKFETSKCLKNHILTMHSEDKKVPCPKENCSATFLPRRLKLHLRSFHAPEKEASRRGYKFQCDDCGIRVKSQRLLENHRKLKHDPNVKTAVCPFCDYKVPIKRRNDIYRYHIKRIHPEQTEIVEKYEKRLEDWKLDFARRAKVQCYLCSYAGSKRSNMARHYEDMHEYDKNHGKNSDQSFHDPDGALCPECGEHFSNKHSLITHLLKVHTRSSGEQCLYCPFRYVDVEEHINLVHPDEKIKTTQFCVKCVPKQSFASFEDLLRHTRSYHRKVVRLNPVPKNKRASSTTSAKNNRLCENCGKTVAASMTMGRHRSECQQRLAEQQSLLEEEYFDELDEFQAAIPTVKSKRYIPVHLSGICPYCEYKFSDLLGHIRHGHQREKDDPENKTKCPLCSEMFNSVRELVTHRQLHPTFKNHVCSKCKSEFESVVELRSHRKECGGRRRRKDTSSSSSAVANSSTSAEKTYYPENNRTIEYEGRGTVPCHICKKTFTLKTLLRRHYLGSHNYDPNAVKPGAESYNEDESCNCKECDQGFVNIHSVIKHYLDFHAVISGQICPYCDSKWSRRKFDDLDAHVTKYHILEMQSPIQTCMTCKTNFGTYEELKRHRQLHEGGNRRLAEFTDQSKHSDPNLIVHSRVGANSEIGNKGGVKCQLCNAFKVRKEHLKIHYIKHHGYDPKLAQIVELPTEETEGDPLECPVCLEFFPNNHVLIKHLLKSHCTYTGMICPYCTGHFPERFVDLQSHVTSVHLDLLTGYNVHNKCKVCRKTFSGYAELRDHVQSHGDAYRDPYGNPELYRETAAAKKRKKRQDESIQKKRDLEEAQLVIDEFLSEDPQTPDQMYAYLDAFQT